MCSIQYGISYITWKLADNVASLSKAWAASFTCLRTNSTLKFSQNDMTDYMLWLRFFLFMLDSVNFSYIGPNGPVKWGTLKQSFAACSNGKAQSPVDLAMTNIVVNNVLKSLDRNYLPTNATLVNHQSSIGVCIFIN